MKLKTMLLPRLAALLCACLTISANADAGTGWYCVRNREHKQPAFGTDLSWVEQFGGYYLDHAHGDDCEDKVLYLTFDAGYENGNVEKILNTLRDEQVPGAFFILGNLIDRNGDLVRRMANEGHTVCNHTYHHPDMTAKTSRDAFAAELTEKALQAFPGHDSEKPLHWEVKPYVGRCIPGGGSTDVSDVSWICPTAELPAATMAAGTPGHSWQLTAPGKPPYAHAMTRYAAKIMAGCAVQLMEDPALLEKAREEHRRQVGSGYVPPIPAGIAPRPMESFIKK